MTDSMTRCWTPEIHVFEGRTCLRMNTFDGALVTTFIDTETVDQLRKLAGELLPG